MAPLLFLADYSAIGDRLRLAGSEAGQQRLLLAGRVHISPTDATAPAVLDGLGSMTPEAFAHVRGLVSIGQQ